MATPVIVKYHIHKFWDDEYKHLDYVREAFNDQVSLDAWRQQGYTGPFTGYMCDMRSTQPSWNSGFTSIFEEMGWKDVCTSYYRMDTGTVLPTHQDLYLKYIELFNLQGQEQTINRAIIFLEDWAPGHYAEYMDEPYTKWTEGATVEWAYDAPHMAANIGTTPRYTLQITGHK